ncbi:MAG: TIGR02206 family membrane protein [Saprospiraceae bacterium]|nr:TIGR02206 family membrane protein [Saprospiraceae bacterium]MCF8249932.1 TIGR02206 family membrane protein [Saprospiraceae bacterium]MCF8279345.1 TIGR02206 family membrane protein [Bacteroidales bacterium]MCF8310036.1 TIGR02206 family membrane protein [Saprospiraceae bacterium]MCF8438936.1 TIGR02206 family membrane protein [Saprospiraceae bacterium]
MPPNALESPFFRPNTDFQLFGNQHLVMIALTLGLAFGISFLVKNRLSKPQQLSIGRAMTLVMAVAVIGWIGIRMAMWEFDYKTDLPFDICNIVALSLPFLMWQPNPRIHEVLYFWIFAGTMQAVLTPHLFEGFPHFTFVKYWTVHGGLVVFAVYATVVYGIRPTWKSLWRSFILLQVYVAALFCINLVLDSNYAYLMRKPPVASALDYLGDYPWYLVSSEVVALVMFVMVLLPLLFKKKDNCRQSPTSVK